MTNIFPLYLYPETNGQKDIEESRNGSGQRTPNLNQEITNEIAGGLGLAFTNEKETTAGSFSPIDIFDYTYAVLHSPAYREKYKVFLKADFPRIPYPNDRATFWQLVKLGGEIRKVHLLESPKLEGYITGYPKAGDGTVTASADKSWELYDKEKQLGRAWINETQYFDNVPLTAWGFYIGGHQPAQKWLKDRMGTKLDYGDILHYQKIIAALSETARLMKEIDGVRF